MIAADELVFLKKKRPDTLKDVKELDGSTLWVSAGGQLEFYPYAGHVAQYGKSAGTLLGAEPIVVKDAVEQVAPKAATFRIPGGDRQVLLVFTRPGSPDAFASRSAHERHRAWPRHQECDHGQQLDSSTMRVERRASQLWLLGPSVSALALGLNCFPLYRSDPHNDIVFHELFLLSGMLAGGPEMVPLASLPGPETEQRIALAGF